MNEEYLLPDPQDFDLERARLARRRKIASELIGTPTNRGVNTGQAFAMSGADPGAFLSQAAGMINQRGIDAEALALAQRERDAANAALSSIPGEQGVARQTAQLRAATSMPSLRDAIKLQLGIDEAEANRQFKREEAEANRIERGEQLAQDRVSREENILTRAQTPNVNVSVAAPRDLELADLKKDLLRSQIVGAMDRHDKAGKPDPKMAQAEADRIAVGKTLDQAEPLLGKATNSGVGAVYDKALALIGRSSTSADAAAQLSSLGGFLVSKMPKMSGPQSDKDVALYKEMAGKLGDPTVPASQKKAALDTIRRYHESGAAQPTQAPPAAPGGWDAGKEQRYQEWKAGRGK